MLYSIIIIKQDNDGNTTTTTAATIDATSAKQAHEHVTAMAARAAGCDVRVYPTLIDGNGNMIDGGIMRGALLVSRRTAANAIKRGGGNVGVDVNGATAAARAKAAATAARQAENTHASVINRMFAMLGELNAANARCNGAENAARIDAVINDYSQDTREYFSVAAAALIDGISVHGADIVECYHDAYLALNRYLSRERAATAHELSTEYIIDGGGDIVAYNSAVASILRGGDKWTPTAGGAMDNATAARLGNAIATAAALLSPTQKHIIELLARGLSAAQIARMTRRNESTVSRNIAMAREKIAAAMGAGEFAKLIDDAKTAAAAKTVKATTARRTASGAAKKAASDKATQAARARAYRERKKAAAAAMAAALTENK